MAATKSNREFSRASMLLKLVSENDTGRLTWRYDDEGQVTVTLSIPDPTELGPKQFVQRARDLRAALAAIGAELGYWLSDEELIASVREHAPESADIMQRQFEDEKKARAVEREAAGQKPKGPIHD